MKIPPRKTSNHSFIGIKKHIMKILMYSIYAFDKPFIENATWEIRNRIYEPSFK
jgi:hypothetical protein